MLGIGSYAFRWHVGIRDRVPDTPMTAMAMLETVAARGVQLLQYADNLPLHLLPGAEIEALKARASGLAVSLELGMAGCDRDSVETYLDLANRLGVRLLRIAPTAEESALENAAIANLLNSVVPSCRAAGVVLAVENHFHLPSPRLVDILDRVDDDVVGVCLDVANSIACQEWPAETINILASRAVNLHLKDYRIALDPHGVGCSIAGTPLGDGVMDINSVFEALGRHGRSINTIIEHWLPWQGSFAASQAEELAWLDRSVAAALRIDAIN
jgi:sugar phosphate isomerase/epimerase